MIDTVTHVRMMPLLDRGRATLARYIHSLAPEERPIGDASLAIVCRADFVAHAALCLQHVEVNRVSLYVLCENGDVCALLSHLTWRRSL